MVLDAHANADARNHKALDLVSIHKIYVRISNTWSAMHDKFIITDRQAVETGSFNY
ncbi:hypothetical protein F3J40_20455 [Pantoea sp. Acro-835]|uniref:PLD phosphodiesterase domain-containing protein n=2 Tax=Candidatus Pantoea multigeneris TaxID=2608357 RepID=A0ABX0RF39_9GAMM|nr:hypothetical protein [Pantoea multigeneris]